MAIKAARPLFKRKAEYVAIRPIKVKGEEVQPGEDVKLRQHHLKALYLRRRIGIKGHPWTEAVLETKGFPKAVISEEPEPKAEVKYDKDGFEEGFIRKTEDGKKWTYEGTEETFKTRKAAVEAAKVAIDEKLDDDDEPTVDPDPEEETNDESNSNDDDVTNDEDDEESEEDEEDEDDESWDD